MLEPLIEFKKVKTFIGMEGEGLNAEIYINGVKCLFMRDAGNGGMIDFDKLSYRDKPNVAVESNVQLIDAWIATLPDTVYPLTQPHADGRTELRIKADYETYFNQKYEDFQRAKDTQKFEKKKREVFKTAIVFGDPAKPEQYNFLNLKKPLSSFPKAWLQQQVWNAKAQYCKGNVQFLNKEELQQAGIIL